MKTKLPAIEDILENFSFLEDWEDRYRYVIELGKALEDFPDEHRTDQNKVQGCVSQVWLVATSLVIDGKPGIGFSGDSDAHIVRGLVAILLATLGNKSPEAILTTDIEDIFQTIGLREHLTPQRSNGLTAMIARARSHASLAINN